MNAKKLLARLLTAGAIVALGASTVLAQANRLAQTAQTAQTAQPDSTTRGAVVTGRDGTTLGIALLGSALLIGVDRSIADEVRGSALHRNDAVRGLMDGARTWGDPGVLVAGAGLWMTGTLTNNRREQLIGVRSLEAIIASEAITATVKVITGRARPGRSPANARDFVFARGIREGNDFESFPSGHATAAFAFAAAVDAEWARLSPTRPRWAAPVLYGVAALTGVSRIFHDAHWTSDVLMGSAIGYVTGHAVVRWHADRRQATP